ncbi:MAG: hypothetical protein WCR33_05080 [Bacilli bacterium]
MKSKILIIITLLQLLSTSLMSQSHRSWEDANRNAAREGKIILVETIKDGVGSKLDKILKDRSFSAFSKSMLIIAKLSETELKFKSLESKFMYSKPPFYAFLMPYGDVISFGDTNMNSSELMFVAQNALKLAKIKRSNSRSVQFENSLSKAKLKAAKENKILCIFSCPEKDREVIFMRQNVFSLDSVADVLNSNFVLFQQHSDKIVSFDFFNNDSKLLFKSIGIKNKEEILTMVKDVLKSDEVIKFQSYDKVLNNQKIMIILYRRSDTESKIKILSVFKDPELKKILNNNYACIQMNESDPNFDLLSQKYNITNTPCICFLSKSGTLVHKIIGIANKEDMINETLIALNNKGLEYYNKQYNNNYKNNNSLEFMTSYLQVLRKSGEIKYASSVVNKFLLEMFNNKKDILLVDTVSDMFMEFYNEVNSPLFLYFIKHEKRFYSRYGKEKVDKKTLSIWKLGATAFIKNNLIDEDSFKNYSKRMKKAKVKNWRDIADLAHLEMYKKIKDWKNYSELGEILFLNNKISDKELYAWALAIKEGSRDKLIRYKAATCLDDAVYRIKKQELKTGHILLSSYKGFFEQLIKELIQK